MINKLLCKLFGHTNLGWCSNCGIAYCLRCYKEFRDERLKNWKGD
ncbi:MAG: DUF1660 family phage protein [Methanosarcinales archaeon]